MAPAQDFTLSPKIYLTDMSFLMGLDITAVRKCFTTCLAVKCRQLGGPRWHWCTKGNRRSRGRLWCRHLWRRMMGHRSDRQFGGLRTRWRTGLLIRLHTGLHPQLHRCANSRRQGQLRWLWRRTQTGTGTAAPAQDADEDGTDVQTAADGLEGCVHDCVQDCQHD